jgi:hypothetical protein
MTISVSLSLCFIVRHEREFPFLNYHSRAKPFWLKFERDDRNWSSIHSIKPRFDEQVMKRFIQGNMRTTITELTGLLVRKGAT